MTLRKKSLTVTIGTDLDRNTVQVVTLTSWGAGDSFKLSYNGSATAAFVNATNGAAADIEAELITLTGDAGLTVTGTDDAGPFTVTFSETPVDILTVTNAVGCTGAVTVNVDAAAVSLRGASPYRIIRIITSKTSSGSPTYEVTEATPGTVELADESPADVQLNSGAGYILETLTTSGLGFTDGDDVTFNIYYESAGDRRF